MSETVRITVDASLVVVLEEIEKSIADMVKKKYGLDEVTIYSPLASKALAAHWKKEKHEISIKKIKNPRGVRKGLLEIT